jgi:hypothetical protein
MLTHREVREIVRAVSGTKDYGYMDRSKTSPELYNLAFCKSGTWEPNLVDAIREALTAAGHTDQVKVTGNGHYLRVMRAGV